jgi:hypothetical protein
MATSHDLTVTKQVQAPRAKVFAAWTTPEIMKHWFFPIGMSVSNAESDIRVGGAYRATMTGEQGSSTVFGADPCRPRDPRIRRGPPARLAQHARQPGQPFPVTPAAARCDGVGPRRGSATIGATWWR